MKRYPKYKDSGIEWLGEIPEHWDLMKVRYIVKSHKQGYYTNQEYIDDGVKLLRITDIDDNTHIDYTNCPFVKISDSDKQDFGLNIDDFVFARSGTIGRFGIVREKMNAVFASYLIKFNFVNKIDPDFIKYYFLSHFFKESLISDLHGGANQNIHAENIKNQHTFLAPPSEQHSISNYLNQKTNQIDTFIQKKQKQVDLLKEYRTAIINDAVIKGLNPNVKMKDSGIEWLGEIPEHWEMKRIKYLTEIISKGTTPSTIGREILDEGEVRFLKAENIYDGKILIIPSFFIDPKTNNLLKRSELKKNDILFVIAGATIGKVGIVNEEHLPANTNQAVSFIRPNFDINPEFIFYWLQSSIIKEIIWLKAVQSAQPNLSMENLGNFPIPFPSINEQVEIINFINRQFQAIDSIITQTETQIQLLQEYRTSLISEVVTGKIDIRDKVQVPSCVPNLI